MLGRINSGRSCRNSPLVLVRDRSVRIAAHRQDPARRRVKTHGRIDLPVDHDSGADRVRHRTELGLVLRPALLGGIVAREGGRQPLAHLVGHGIGLHLRQIIFFVQKNGKLYTYRGDGWRWGMRKSVTMTGEEMKRRDGGRSRRRRRSAS